MGNLIEKFNNLDKSIKRTIIGGLIVVIILVLFVFIVGTLNNRKLSYSKLEEKIKKAAVSYYEKHENKLPETEGGEVKLDINTLVKGEYIKELSEYNDDDCDADVYVTKSNDEYVYSVYLMCDDYKTNTLVSYIENNVSTVTSGEGLYTYNDELIYRGENINNYIEFSGNLWRILRINEDNSIRIIQAKTDEREEWDDRYNIDVDEYQGINNFEMSRIKDELNAFGNKEDNINPEHKKWIIAKNVCMDKKNGVDFNNIYSIACTNYSAEKYQFSLLQLEEYFAASIDSNCNSMGSDSCTNYNYLASGTYWTITPSADYSNKVYMTGTSTKARETNRAYKMRVVTNLSAHVLYESGDGTEENPYKIKY